ncbi:DUF4276 family protein [Prosthecobacter algae]|uniref:DUF4276 family protein n=1 Tax=Prosthecobacter algae TaxID=1144682 RepID=A0ABP9PD50_9BACT
MRRIVFLLEEQSMVELLRGILPKIFPDWVENQHWIAVHHNGKSDLEASIPRKLRAWNIPEDRFVIMRDNDGGDCRAHKQRLLGLAAARDVNQVLVRIVCQELEGWFLGDLDAVAAAYPVAARKLKASHRKYHDPDRMTNAADELYRLTDVPGKVGRARAISGKMAVEANLSQSFQVFVAGLRRLVGT